MDRSSFFRCHLLLQRLVRLLSLCLPVLCQSFGFMPLVFLCPIQQVINPCRYRPSSCFLSIKFSFQQLQSIWSTGTSLNVAIVCYFVPREVICDIQALLFQKSVKYGIKFKGDWINVNITKCTLIARLDVTVRSTVNSYLSTAAASSCFQPSPSLSESASGVSISVGQKSINQSKPVSVRCTSSLADRAGNGHVN